MENSMIISSARYTTNFNGANDAINATIDGQQMSIPMDTGNRHYAEILRQVEAGDLTIAAAD
jgi:hypothetical protein